MPHGHLGLISLPSPTSGAGHRHGPTGLQVTLLRRVLAVTQSPVTLWLYGPLGGRQPYLHLTFGETGSKVQGMLGSGGP
jgi:hypothetical protein